MNRRSVISSGEATNYFRWVTTASTIRSTITVTERLMGDASQAEHHANEMPANRLCRGCAAALASAATFAW